MVQYSIDKSQHGHKEESVEKRGEVGSPNCMDILRSLRDKIRSYKDDNEKLVRAQKKQIEVNEFIQQSFSNLHKQNQHDLEASHNVK